MDHAHSPPVFLRLAGHPLRWRILTELASSDRHVRELMDLLGRPQSLVSYHLGRLKSSRLVAARRSSADGRDAYYSVNLARCGELISAAGGGLHPGLRLVQPVRCETTLSEKARVLFLCTGNSARSQIAEALLEQLSNSTAEAFSAGSQPKRLHPNAVRVMQERGVDISHKRAKHLSEFATSQFDYVISLCDKVREVCPEFPQQPRVIHWSLPDPAGEGATDDETYPVFQHTALNLETRIRFLLHAIQSSQISQEVN